MVRFSGVSAEVYARRRRQVMERMGPGSAAIIPAAPLSVRSNDVEYVYRGDNDLLYLTGFPEPEAVCLLLPGHPQEEFVLFVRPRDPERETWIGRRAGVEGAVTTFGASRAYPIQQLNEKVGELVSDRNRLYYRFGRDAEFNERMIGWMRQWQLLRPRSGKGPNSILDPAEIVHELRLIKSTEELQAMRQAADIAVAGHVAAMRAVRDGMYEFEIEALLDSTFRRLGAAGPAYPSIVASGANATILHYTNNDRQMRDGDLLLIDAGAEFQHYCSDVTRAFPVSGVFTRPQRGIYEIVLQAQLAAIEAIRPGVVYDEPHRRAVETLVQGLLDVKLLSGDRGEVIEKELYKPFFMHRTSHWLGMDVHDVGMYKHGDVSRVLEPGMVLTVEPGLYVAADNADVDAQYRGIGVRIEDDVLVTSEGFEVLTAAAPKECAEIEKTALRSV